MTRIDFHFNTADKLSYGCRLVRKIYRSGLRCQVICADFAEMNRFDEMLWSFSKREFIPHVRADHELAAETPVVLATEGVDTEHLDVVVNLSGQTPSHFSRFQRLIEVVSTAEPDRVAARERWRLYRDRGYPMHRHDLGGAQ